MEEYRSGHNEPHSKCGVPQGTVGSNPTSSAKKALKQARFRAFLISFRMVEKSPRIELLSMLSELLSKSILFLEPARQPFSWIVVKMLSNCADSYKRLWEEARKNV
jgi:hypothetical protein